MKGSSIVIKVSSIILFISSTGWAQVFGCGRGASARAQQNRQEPAQTVQFRIREALSGLSPTPSGKPGAPPAANRRASSVPAPTAQAQARRTPTGATVPNTFFVTWRDPQEGAFQLGVPSGWQVSGGTLRAAPINPRHVVQAQSPDGKIRVFIDDPDIQPRQVPNVLMRQHGFHEGQMLQGPAGPVLLARYLSGAQFAQQYIGSKLCRNPQITQVLDLTHASEQMNARIYPIAAQQGKSVRANVGEARFRCGNILGYTIANTVLAGEASGFGAQTWHVYQLGGFVVSDPAQEGFAWYVLNTMLETFRMDPSWEARFARQIQDVLGVVMQTQRVMAQSIARYAQRQACAASAGGLNHPNSGMLPTDLRKKWAIEARISQERSDATMGQKWWSSPTAGNVRLSNSFAHPWMNNNHHIVEGPSNGEPPLGSHGQYHKLEPGWRP